MKHSISRTHLLLLTLILRFLLNCSSKNSNFSFQTFSFRNLTLLGDSYLRLDGSIGLTRESGVPSSSSGSATFNLPIRFHDPRSNLSASFSTNFTFSISNPNPQSYGDGFAFFLSPSNLTLGSPGAYLGLFNSSSLHIKNSYPLIAVEFDTKLDASFADPSQNHVGFDIGSPASIKVTDLEPLGGINLKSGDPITAWIDYNQDDTSIKVFLSTVVVKPKNPVLFLSIDLSKHFSEFMYVGFSGSTEGSTEVHTIERWSFETFGLPLPSRIANNVSDASSSSSSSSWSSTAIPAMPLTNSTGHSHKKLILSIVISAPLVLAVIFVAILWFAIKKSALMKGGKPRFKPEFMKGPRKFSYAELRSATRGFHNSRIIGNGAFGTVYRAVDLKSGVTYAVKRSKQAQESKTEFSAELNIIAGLRHKNLVQLQGWCTDKKELLLVYDLMPNGSLDKILYPQPGNAACPAFNWEQRYNAATGIASVLTYLHQECDQRVIHRDIKTSNIMLDSEFNPRLGDFGLARLMDHNKSPVSTLTAGTMGYLAPEYLQYGTYTEKTDVFSYGVVVLEICCGRRPIDKGEEKDDKVINLVDWVWGLYAKDRIFEAVDKRLNGEFDKDDMLRLLLLGLSCVNPNSDERPSMRRVIQILNREGEPVTVPKVKPLLVFSSSDAFDLLEIVSAKELSVNSSPLYEPSELQAENGESATSSSLYEPLKLLEMIPEKEESANSSSLYEVKID